MLLQVRIYLRALAGGEPASERCRREGESRADAQSALHSCGHGTTSQERTMPAGLSCSRTAVFDSTMDLRRASARRSEAVAHAETQAQALHAQRAHVGG